MTKVRWDRVTGYNPVSYSKRNELAIYGEFCEWCGESDLVVLEIDHIIPQSQITEYKDDNPFLKHVLCANCHKRKSRMEMMWERWK